MTKKKYSIFSPPNNGGIQCPLCVKSITVCLLLLVMLGVVGLAIYLLALSTICMPQEEKDFGEKKERLEELMTIGNLARMFGSDTDASKMETYDPEIQIRTNSKDDGKINFILYTTKNLSGVQITHESPWTIHAAGFIDGAPTKIICHGFMSDYKQGPGRYLLPAYMGTRAPVNVILVNWATLARMVKKTPPPEPTTDRFKNVAYFPPARHTSLVGVETAKLVKVLIDYGHVTPSHIHLIGHSLGAHAMGFAGKHLAETTGTKVARLTALDPAGPCFETFGLFCIGHNFNYRPVNRADAQFVDVIHTNARMFGMKAPVGHADFYVNGGYSQPECGILSLGLCSHSRANTIMAESISKTPSAFFFVAHKCYSWQIFNLRHCFDTDTALLGEDCSTTAMGVHYIAA